MRILITAGPTREPIDAVRVLSNRSSGRMGIALAADATARGHDVTLLLGQGATAVPADGLDPVWFDSTHDLATLLAAHAPACELLIMAAAVSDFIPERAAKGKLDRRDGVRSLSLSPAPDLLAGVAKRRRAGQRIVGFALEEADHLETRARDKLKRKGLDAIVANPLATMEAADISGLLIEAGGGIQTAPRHATKEEFATWLLNALLR